MTEPRVSPQRPDVDIQAEIHHLMLGYPPLNKDRHSVDVTVTAGVVKLVGHVQTPSTRRYFLDQLPAVPGVVSVDASQLFDDESIRLEIGRILPTGVNVGRCRYGTIVLVGRPPKGLAEAVIVEQVRQIPGVTQVMTDLEE